MLQVHLPHELHDMIIDFAHSERNTIAQCGLVCRSWLPTSRLHLFFNLELVHRYHSTSKNNIEALEPLLRPTLWPHPPMNYIHHFSITTRTGHKSEAAWVNTILTCLPELPKLRSLSLCLVRWQDISPGALVKVNYMLPQLHSLHIRCSTGITIADLRALARRSHSLPWKELEFRVYLEDYTRKRLWIHCSQTQFRLTASDPDHDAKVEFVYGDVWRMHCMTAQWTEIEFSIRWNHHIYDELQAVMCRLAPVLHTLRLVVDYNSVVHPFFDLSKHTALNRLMIRYYIMDNVTPGWLLDTLASIPSNSLCQVDVDIEVVLNSVQNMLDNFEQHLTTLLEEITICVNLQISVPQTPGDTGVEVHCAMERQVEKLKGVNPNVNIREVLLL